MHDDLDVSSLSDRELRERIQWGAQESPAEAGPGLDLMRAELVRRLSAREAAAGDAPGGSDDPGGVREPARPMPPGGGAAIERPHTDAAA